MYCTAGGILLYLLLKSATAEKEVDFIDFLPCLDHKGKEVEHGDRFFPFGSDPCNQCTCLNGKPQMCIAVFCSPPENCRQYRALSNKCCEFVCLDRDFPNKASGNGTYPGKDVIMARAKSKKISVEKKRKLKREREQKRRDKIKENPELYEEYKKKDLPSAGI